MSFSHDSPWPSSTTSGASDETHHFFPSVDRDDPSSSSSPSTSHHPIIQINPGSTLPRHAPSPPPHRLRAITSPSTRTRTISSLPMTSSTKIVKSAPNPSIVKTEEVWREILKTSYGRDKAFVCTFLNILICVLKVLTELSSRTRNVLNAPRMTILLENHTIHYAFVPAPPRTQFRINEKAARRGGRTPHESCSIQSGSHPVNALLLKSIFPNLISPI